MHSIFRKIIPCWFQKWCVKLVHIDRRLQFVIWKVSKNEMEGRSLGRSSSIMAQNIWFRIDSFWIWVEFYWIAPSVIKCHIWPIPLWYSLPKYLWLFGLIGGWHKMPAPKWKARNNHCGVYLTWDCQSTAGGPHPNRLFLVPIAKATTMRSGSGLFIPEVEVQW